MALDKRKVTLISLDQKSYVFESYRLANFINTPIAKAVADKWHSNPDANAIEIPLIFTSQIVDQLMNYLSCEHPAFLPTATTPPTITHTFNFYLFPEQDIEPAAAPMQDMDSREVPKNLIPLGTPPMIFTTNDSKFVSAGTIITTIRIDQTTSGLQYLQFAKLTGNSEYTDFMYLHPIRDHYINHDGYYHLKQGYIDQLNQVLRDSRIRICCQAGKNITVTGYGR